jgi:two-component system, chemotaxis family, protein-glutamate methylesterase/glutaminase
VIRVLVVDDSALVRKLFGRVLSDEAEFEIGFARDGREALERLEEFQPDVVTLDVEMPQMNGLECLDRIMVQRPCRVVMVSSVTDVGAEATLNALRLGAVDFIPKPAGAVSLRIEEFAPLLKEKIRSAATARLPASLRLRERVQFNAGVAPRRERRKAERAEERVDAAEGDGLVLVGTSTGGPPALEALLVPLPATFAWPILIAQHMPAGFTGPLANRLDKLCALHVVEVTKNMPIEAGHVYIGRGEADIVVSRRPSGLIAQAVPAKASYLWHPSTDRLVRSALQQVAARQLVGILMTGMGNDGAEAMAALRAEGGRTIAESEETAVVWGMPGELVRLGGATWTVPLPRIAQRLQQVVPSHAARP